MDCDVIDLVSCDVGRVPNCYAKPILRDGPCGEPKL